MAKDEEKQQTEPVVQFLFDEDDTEEEKEELRQIIRSLQERARAGSSEAMLKLGRHFAGQGFLKPDYGTAVKLFQQAAEAGEQAAYEELGDLYYEGKGLDRQYGKALACYKKCGDVKRAGSWYRMGEMYRLGLGTNQNVIQALACYDEVLHGPIEDGYADYHQPCIFRINDLQRQQHQLPDEEDRLLQMYEDLAKARLLMLRNPESRELAEIPKQELDDGVKAFSLEVAKVLKEKGISYYWCQTPISKAEYTEQVQLKLWDLDEGEPLIYEFGNDRRDTLTMVKVELVDEVHYLVKAYLNFTPGDRTWKCYVPDAPWMLDDANGFLKSVMVDDKGVDFMFSHEWEDVTYEEKHSK